MIARISNAGSYLAGAIQYNTNKVGMDGASLIACENFHLEPGTDIDAETALPLMLAQLNLNRRVEKGVFSCSLNPNLQDLSNLDDLVKKNKCNSKDEFYSLLAKEYMQGMGYGNQPYLVFRHNDIDREHIHIVSIRVNANGERINNYNEHRRSDRVREKINQQFGMSTEGEIHSSDLSEEQQKNLAMRRSEYVNRASQMIATFSGEVQSRQDIASVKQARSNLFHTMSNALKFVNENFQPKDLKEYNKILSQFNIVCKQTDSENADGKRISGCQYAAIDDEGKISSHLIAGFKFGRDYTLTGLEKRFSQNSGSDSIRKNSEYSRRFIASVIDSALRVPTLIDLQSVIEQLSERGIKTDIVRDIKDNTQVKGISFVDLVNGTTFNGNNIGKAYSYKHLLEAIEKHNLRFLNSNDDDNRKVFVSKEVYKEGARLLNSEYNKIRKANYYLESDAIKGLRGEENEKRYIDALLNQSKTALTRKEAQTIFESYRRFKEKNLPEVEFKETAYAKKQIIAAIQFATHIPSNQNRADFLFRAGVISGKSADGSMVFISAIKPDARIDFNGISKNFKKILFEGLPDADNNKQLLSKEERQFMNAFVNGTLDDCKKIKGDFTSIADMLTEKDRQKISALIHIPKEELLESYKKFSAEFRKIMRNGQYHYMSDLINNIDNHEAEFLAVLNTDSILKNLRIFDLYKKNLLNHLPDVIKKEQQATVNRCLSAVLFARRIQKPALRAEFLMRMGVKAEFENGALILCRSDKPEYRVSWFDLMHMDPRLSDEDRPFTQTVIEPTDPNAKIFSKKERDFIEMFNENAWPNGIVDPKFTSATKYLGDEDKIYVKRMETSCHVSEFFNRHPEMLDKDSSDIVTTVRALLCRGYIIKPVTENGETRFKIGMHNADERTYIDLAFPLQERLRNSNYVEAYPSLRQLVLGEKLNSPKMRVLKIISRAEDFSEPELLTELIAKMATRNRPLSIAMTQAMGIENGGVPDYRRVANLVLDYRGETNIILPPPSRAQDEQKAKVSTESYYEMLSAIRNGTALSLILNDGENNDNDINLHL